MKPFKIIQDVNSTLDEILDLFIQAMRSLNFSIISKSDIVCLKLKRGDQKARGVILQVAYPRFNSSACRNSGILDELIHCNLVLWELNDKQVHIEISKSVRYLSVQQSKIQRLGAEVNHLLTEIMKKVSLSGRTC